MLIKRTDHNYSDKFFVRSGVPQTPCRAENSPPASTLLDIFAPTKSQIAKMGRLHSNGKGISGSAIPYSRTPPAWLKTTPEQVVDQICKLARKGATYVS
jgi:hypothetical protein